MTSQGTDGSTAPLSTKLSDRVEAATKATINEGVKQKEDSSHSLFLSKYYDTILSNLSDGILAIDNQGNIITYNKMAEAILEIPKEDALFQPYWKNFNDTILGFSLRDTLKNRTLPGCFHATLRNENENEKEIETNTYYIPTDLETSQLLIVTIRDITEQKNQEVILQRKNRMHELGEMAAMIAHEIRNPLGGIKGFASLLERDLMDRPDLQKMSSYIIQGTNDLNELVSRVLNYSRPITTHFDAIDLTPFIDRIKDEVLRDHTYIDNVAIEVKATESPITATVDVQSMRSSMINLITNSIEALPEGGGKITINVEKDDNDVFIKVTDTGIGIPEENMKKVFSPFFTTKPDGDGFGLSEVHKIIQLHGGKIEVKSEVDVGTTFTLKIPLNHTDHR